MYLRVYNSFISNKQFFGGGFSSATPAPAPTDAFFGGGGSYGGAAPSHSPAYGAAATPAR